MPLPREYISHNQVRLYIECPLKYCFHYIDNLVPPLNDRILLGSAFHSAIEHYFCQKISHLPIELESLLAIFRDQMRELAEEREVQWKSSTADTERRGLAFVRYFFDQIGPAINPILCEKELTCTIPGTSIPLKGIIDLVEEDFCITDFKTTTSKWSEGRAQNSLQMIIYKFLFDSCYGPVRSSLKFEILSARTPASVKHQTIRISPAEEEIQRMLDVVVHVVENIERGHFPKNEGSLCRFCDFRAECKKK